MYPIVSEFIQGLTGYIISLPCTLLSSLRNCSVPKKVLKMLQILTTKSYTFQKYSIVYHFIRALKQYLISLLSSTPSSSRRYTFFKTLIRMRKVSRDTMTHYRKWRHCPLPVWPRDQWRHCTCALDMLYIRHTPLNWPLIRDCCILYY